MLYANRGQLTCPPSHSHASIVSGAIHSTVEATNSFLQLEAPTCSATLSFCDHLFLNKLWGWTYFDCKNLLWKCKSHSFQHTAQITDALYHHGGICLLGFILCMQCCQSWPVADDKTLHVAKAKPESCLRSVSTTLCPCAIFGFCSFTRTAFVIPPSPGW